MAESAAGRQAPPDPRRRDPRLRPPGLPRDPRLRHRRRGGRRLRARLPLLQLQGRGPQRALRRALVAAAGGDRGGRPRGASRRARSCDAVAGFIVDSYRHDPELMKVIIVEVTRAANSFGRTHLPEIRRAYDSIAKIVADGQEAGAFRADIDPDLRLDVLLRRDRAAALGLDLRGDPGRRRRLRPGKGPCGRRRSATASSRDR